jgi:cyanophycinase-like exopeptidase
MIMTDLFDESGAKPGILALFGSGETSPSGRKVFDRLLKDLPAQPRLALVETPAGFELNSAQVIERVAEFLRHRLQNYDPHVYAVPARRRGTSFSPDDRALAAPLLEADLIFMGPGSPTYAVRQLRESVTWHYIRARHRLGAPLALASAAVIAISAFALPVYEIYKVGEDPHWKPGLDFFGDYGLPLVFVPHWNNNDGGDELDTSRCFMGQQRFAELVELLPPDLTIVGIDESTVLMMDLRQGTCQVVGLGGVTVIHTGHEHSAGQHPISAGLAQVAEQRRGHIHVHPDGDDFLLSECCPIDLRGVVSGLPPAAWKAALAAQARLDDARREAVQPPETLAAPPEVLALAEQRQQARLRKDWPEADRLRAQLADLGWKITDTATGPVVEKL